jgi:hypothetical protein
MLHRTTAVVCLSALSALFAVTPTARAAQEEATREGVAALLPANTLVSVEVADLGASVRALMALPAWERFDEGPLGAAARAEPKVEKALTGLIALGAAAGTDELGLLDALAEGGSVLGLLPPETGAEEPAAVVIFRAGDAEAVQAAFNTLLALVSLGTMRVSGDNWRIPLGDGVAERRDGLFLLGSTASALDQVHAQAQVSASMSESDASLVDAPGYREAHLLLGDVDLAVWARGELFLTSPGIPEKAENVGASLLVGGVAEVLRRTRWAAAGLEVGAEGLSARFLAPAESVELRESHGPLLPPPAEIEVPRTPARLATLILQRDLGPWWTARDDFVAERGVAESVEADGNLSVVFQRDLGSEVMRWLEPELVLIVDRNRFDGAAPEPEFPAGALGLTPRAGHPSDYHQAFVNAFMAVITFSNFDGGKDATRPMLQPDVELLADGSRLYSASYRRTGDTERRPARENLSPGLLLHHDGRVWIGSSDALLRDIAAASGEKVPVHGDALTVDFGGAHDLLEDNEEVLFAQRLLKEGGDARATQDYVERLVAAAGLFDGLRLNSGFHADHYEISVTVPSR